MSHAPLSLNTLFEQARTAYAFEDRQVREDAVEHPKTASADKAIVDRFVRPVCPGRIASHQAVLDNVNLDLQVYLFTKNLTANGYYVGAYGDLFAAALRFGVAWLRTFGIRAEISF